MRNISSRMLLGSCLFVLGVGGCNPADNETNSSSPESMQIEEHSHSHDHGPHEGAVADWGGGKYHVEFTVDHDKKEATVYILDADAKKNFPIKTEKILLSIKEPVFQLELMAAPQVGESDGLSSRFIGVHESLGIVQEFSGTISGEVDGTPYAGDFAEEAHADHHH